MSRGSAKTRRPPRDSPRDAAPGDVIPILQPQLPRAEDLLPYLREIDRCRIYSNWGPLSGEFERRLCECFQLPAGAVASASSGTAALVGVALATAGRATRERPVAILPAFTFVATAIAIEQCGYEIHLADVNERTWMLDPERLASDFDLSQVGLVVPVAPYGRPVPQASWRNFRARTGVPVVIDGAATFEAVVASPKEYLGDIPLAMSFHATKSFSTAEGGCVASADIELTQRTIRALNFGFYGRRDCASASTNGKMSEYHAAVGLAELERWDDKHAALRRTAETYKAVLGDLGLTGRLFCAPDVASVYVLFRAESPDEAERVTSSLAESGISYRVWYGGGLHRQTHFSGLRREALPVTDALAPLLLGLPTAQGLPASVVRRIGDALRRALGQS